MQFYDLVNVAAEMLAVLCPTDRLSWQVFSGFLQSLQENAEIVP
jgi:hypothetical protein